MNLTCVLLISVGISFAFDAPHRFLLLDEGNSSLLLVDRDGGKEWTTLIDGNSRDMQLIGKNRVIISMNNGGYGEYDLATGELKKKVTGFGGVQSVRRLSNGHTLLAGEGLDGSGGVVVLELDTADKKINKIVYDGFSTFRMMRLTSNNHILFGSNSQVVEGDEKGKVVWKADVAGASVYKALRLPNGDIWLTSGYGASLVLLDTAGKILKTLGSSTFPREVNPHFFADFQILTNGNFVVTNWQAHGGGHGGDGIQLFEIDSVGNLVWQHKQDPNRISSLHGVLVLDGLNTQLGYDEIGGTEQAWSPVTQINPIPKGVASTKLGFSKIMNYLYKDKIFNISGVEKK